MPHSSRGPGHRPLKAEIIGSNPICGTKQTLPTPPDRAPGAFIYPARAIRLNSGCPGAATGPSDSGLFSPSPNGFEQVVSERSFCG
jgi:hypothetical protein